MRWIDIILPEPETNQKLDTMLAEAARGLEELELIQQRDGLDNVSVVRQMAEVGQLLFQGIIAVDPLAFDPAEDRKGSRVPLLEDKEHDTLVGYHVVADSTWPSLPWNWLHNGLEFLLEKHPIVASSQGSDIPVGNTGRPWMERCRRAEFLVGDDGSSALVETLDQLRPEDQTSPEFLFVPGHTDDKIRRMIFREAEAIEGALSAASSVPRPLARIHVPPTPVTPGQLSGLSLTYQALHFAGPVSHAGGSPDGEQADWMDRLVQDMHSRTDDELEQAFGLEGEVLGIDPITSLLDDVSEKYDQQQLAGHHANETAAAAQGRAGGGSSREMTGDSVGGRVSSTPWLLEDGPVEPESLGKAGGIPPLVYSNSYRALPELGARFIAAGASTFIGPVVPLFSRPARIFSGYCYQALGEGWCAGAAVWKAARNCRRELGRDHPAWLSYGVYGFGTLALHYL